MKTPTDAWCIEMVTLRSFTCDAKSKYAGFDCKSMRSHFAVVRLKLENF
jgi:hypothetical protein